MLVPSGFQTLGEEMMCVLENLPSLAISFLIATRSEPQRTEYLPAEDSTAMRFGIIFWTLEM
jgi:hypothetical protein